MKPNTVASATKSQKYPSYPSNPSDPSFPSLKKPDLASLIFDVAQWYLYDVADMGNQGETLESVLKWNKMENPGILDSIYLRPFLTIFDHFFNSYFIQIS